MAGKSGKPLLQAALYTSALIVFSFFISYPFPARAISFVILGVMAVFIAIDLSKNFDLKRITGAWPPVPALILFIIIGIAGGVFIGMLYRYRLESPLIPSGLGSFALVAALIGASEELIFRGYIQNLIPGNDTVLRIFTGTFSHTLYKCALFISPAAALRVDLSFLAAATFITGIIFGTVNNATKSILPSLIAHAVFDIWVYGELSGAPAWVW